MICFDCSFLSYSSYQGGLTKLGIYQCEILSQKSIKYSYYCSHLNSFLSQWKTKTKEKIQPKLQAKDIACDVIIFARKWTWCKHCLHTISHKVLQILRIESTMAFVYSEIREIYCFKRTITLTENRQLSHLRILHVSSAHNRNYNLITRFDIVVALIPP